MPAPGWTAVPNHVADELMGRGAAGRNAFAVLWQITRSCRPGEHDARPSHAVLAERCGLSVSAVRRAVALLTDLGHLVVTRRRRPDGWDASNAYRVVHRAVHRVFTSDHPVTRIASRVTHHGKGAQQRPPEKSKTNNRTTKTRSTHLPPRPDGLPAAVSWDRGTAHAWTMCQRAGYDPAAVLARHDWTNPHLRSATALAMVALSDGLARPLGAPQVMQVVQVQQRFTYDGDPVGPQC